MAIVPFYYCSLFGKDFDPRPILELGVLNVVRYGYRGKVEEHGADKGKICDVGYIGIRSDTHDLEEFLRLLLLPEIKSLVLAAEERVLYVTMDYYAQCNWEFRVNEVAQIHDLGLVLAVTCYGASNETIIVEIPDPDPGGLT